MKVLISIVVPCYKQAQFLPEALLSVLSQTYKYWECIIVNDGSPDNTEEIAMEWCKRDPRFLYIAKENGGLSSARNAGIQMAKGRYILPVDADDKICENYIKEAVEVFYNDSSVDLVYSKACLFGDKQGEWKLPPYSFSDLLVSNMIFCSALMKRDRMIECGLYDVHFKDALEDWEFLLRYLCPESKVVQLNQFLFFYRIKVNSRSGTLYNSDHLIRKTHHDIYKKHFKLYDLYCEDLITIMQKKNQLELEINKLLKEKSVILKYRNTSFLWFLSRFRLLLGFRNNRRNK